MESGVQCGIVIDRPNGEAILVAHSLDDATKLDFSTTPG